MVSVVIGTGGERKREIEEVKRLRLKLKGCFGTLRSSSKERERDEKKCNEECR